MSEFKDKIMQLARRSQAAESQALTEEATKTSVILPFLQALGFDVFSLDDVVPEFVADVGTKKGEKVDFALKIDGKVAMLVEAKPINVALGNAQFSQLYRYFSVTDARLGILTNGREAWFFSDTDAPNKMDKKPFFKFDFQSHEASQLEELALFRKENFAVETIIEAASNLKYTRAAAAYLKAQLEEPSDEFVRFFGKQIYDGSITKSVLEQIKPAVQAALDDVIRDRIQDKLSITFSQDNASVDKDKTTPEPHTESPRHDGIETTEEELQAYMIVKAIGAKLVGVDRVAIRDAKSYCAILMDDNNRKPICRLYFNSANSKSIGIFDADKNETRHKLSELNEIYEHAQEIESVINSYL